MTKKKNNSGLIISSLVFVIFLFLLTYINNKKIETATKAVLIKNNKEIELEIARDENQRRLGLMFRKELCKECGMIFIFEDEDIRKFWMKNTYIPLDIIFVSKNFKINEIFKNLPAFKENMNEKEIPKAEAKAKYVIEINAGMSDELELKKNEKLKIIWK